MKMERFLLALKEDDFGVGDSLWLGNFEFEVVGKRGPNNVAADDDTIFRAVAMEQRFVNRSTDPCRPVRYRDDSMSDDALRELERAAVGRLVAGGAGGPCRARV